MKKGHIIIVIFVIIGISKFLMAQSSSLAGFNHLKEPKISIKKNQKVLVVEAKGNPNIIGGKAFGLLFQLYYSMPETAKGPMQSAPRARWPVLLETPKSEWIGLYALPVPDSITEPPKHEEQTDLKASVVTWEYGKVAEILHIGPYDKEEPTVQRLMDFVKKQGYRVFGRHEEEYIKGPDMNGKGDPDKYITIIRYRLQKSDGSSY